MSFDSQPHPRKEQKKTITSPYRLLLTAILCAFLADLAGLLHVFIFPHNNSFPHLLVDTVVSLCFILVLLYIFMFRPLLHEINERRRAEEALQQANERLESRVHNQTQELAAIVQSSDDAIIGMTIDGTITSWNAGAENIYGYPAGEAIGKSITLLATAETANESPQILEKVRRGERIQHYETVRWRKDGSPVTVSLVVSPIRDGRGKIIGVSAIARDISRRIEAEIALQNAYADLGIQFHERTVNLGKAIAGLQAEMQKRVQAENQLRLQTTALEAAANGIIITDASGRIEWANPAFTRITGYPEEDILGKNPRFLKSGQHNREFYQGLWNTILGGKVWQGELVNRRRDGTIYYEESTITPVQDENGQVAHFVAIVHDITERKRAEEHIRERNQKLEELYQAEQKARKLADTLRDASLALTETLSLPTVTGRLLETIARLVPYDCASVVLFNAEMPMKVWASYGYDRLPGGLEALSRSLELETNPVVHALIKNQQSIRISDTSGAAGWATLAGFEAGHSWLGVPILAAGRPMGLCELRKTETGFFTDEHVEWIEALVHQSAVVIQNTWLFEQVRSGRERLQALSHRLVEVQENERRYIARELHDEAGQMLTSLMIGLELLDREAEDPAAVKAGIAELNRLVEDVLDNLHRLAVDLRPVSLDHLGLAASLRQHIENLSEKHKLLFNFQTLGMEERLPAEIETAIYRIVQEALTNILRHANASRVDILLERRSDRLIAMIEDNGDGFDPAAQNQPDQLGLFGMRERAKILNGSLSIESSPESGTTVYVEVPLCPSGS